MNLIDRYIYSVTEKLPEDSREDVGRELRANIEDMLPDDAKDSDIRKVLESLGDPIKLADEYRQVKRYLIGPSLYDNYISVLKLVVSIVVIVFSFITITASVFDASIDGGFLNLTIEIFINVLAGTLQGVIQAVLWVTLVFAIIERTGVSHGTIPFSNKKWSVDDMPLEIIHSKRKISRVETAFGMFFTVLFISVLYCYPQFMGIYEMGGNGSVSITPLLVNEVLHSYMWLIVLLFIVSFCILIWKFIYGYWNVPIAIACTILNIAVCLLVFTMVNDKALLNQEFISRVADLTKIPFSKIVEGLDLGKLIFIVSFIAISFWDSISGFLKCKK